MKRGILMLFFTMFSIPVFSQWEFKPVVSLSHNTFLFGSYWTFSNGLPNYSYSQSLYMTGMLCQRVDFNGGINLIHNNYSLGLKLSSQYFVARGINSYKGAKFSYKGLMKNYLLGLNIINRFRERKIIRPFVCIDLASEVATNYRNRYLREVDYYPHISFFYSPSPWNRELNIYHSTPFVGDLLAGCDFRIYKGFSANIAIGYGVRVLRVQYAEVTFPAGQQPSAPISEEKIGNPYSSPLNYMVIQVGLSYAFSFQKKTKNRNAMSYQATLSQQPVDRMTLGFTKVAGFHPWLGYSADFDWNNTYLFLTDCTE